MKRTWSWILAILLAASLLLTADALQAPLGTVGDVNNDKTIDAVDYLLLKRYVLETQTMPKTSEDLYRADINQDGTIDLPDYLALKKYLLAEPDGSAGTEPTSEFPTLTVLSRGTERTLSFHCGYWMDGENAFIADAAIPTDSEIRKFLPYVKADGELTLCFSVSPERVQVSYWDAPYREEAMHTMDLVGWPSYTFPADNTDRIYQVRAEWANGRLEYVFRTGSEQPTYAVFVDDPDDLAELTEAVYHAGEPVEIPFAADTEHLYAATLDGEELSSVELYPNGRVCFVMPERDCTVRIWCVCDFYDIA